jgi:hypothetical protein
MCGFLSTILTEFATNLDGFRAVVGPQAEENTKVRRMSYQLQPASSQDNRQDAILLTSTEDRMKIFHSVELFSRAPRRCKPVLAVRTFVFFLLLCLSGVQGRAQQQNDQQQMRGLDEEVQQVKSDVLSIAAELNQLEEKLLYPSGTQVAIFIALAKGDQMRLDAVRVQIDGQLVAHYIYSFKELEALRKGGVQRVYVGNVVTGDHKLEVIVDGKLEGGADFNRTENFTFRKEVKPKMLGLTVAGPASGNTPIALGEW